MNDWIVFWINYYFLPQRGGKHPARKKTRQQNKVQKVKVGKSLFFKKPRGFFEKKPEKNLNSKKNRDPDLNFHSLNTPLRPSRYVGFFTYQISDLVKYSKKHHDNVGYIWYLAKSIK